MDEMVVAHINAKMLTWARERAGLELSRLAKGSVTVEKIKAWENGSEYPTQSQAIAIAEKLGISYAMLFMPNVPAPDVPNIPDLRTVGGQPLKHPSLDFREVLNDTLLRQEWIREERIEAGQPLLSFVGSFKISNDPLAVAKSMRSWLQLTQANRTLCPDFEAFIKHIVARAESIGLLIMRSAVVRHDTHRTLEVGEFRGFALSDAYAPIVFVNDADAKAAQVFTLAHEIAHIWLGANGVSDRRPNQKKDSTNAVELFCDRVAAAVLAPEQEFLAVWKNGPAIESAGAAARHFRVSTLVALRRAKDLGRISFDTFIEAVDQEYERFKQIDSKKREQQKKKEASGGNFWASFEIRNSSALNAAVVAAITSRRTTFTEAASLLGVTIGSTVRYLRRVGA